MTPHKNRNPANPNRFQVAIEGGATYNAIITRADNPPVGEEGTFVGKQVLDEMLTASGTTAGTSPVYTLVQAGFTLFDGAVVRCKLHAPIAGVMTLNVNDTGAKAVKTPKGRPCPTYPINTWITVVYDSVSQNFILQGEGGGMKTYGKYIGQISSYQFDTEEGCRY